MTEESTQLQYENARLRRLLAQAGVDAEAQDVASKLQKLLIAELHHRVKNLLSMVLAITGQTLRSATTLDSASKAIQNRIMILARSFDLLIEEEMDALPLRAILETATEPYNIGDHFEFNVPTVHIAALPALSIALVVNELCTNAVKYGALVRQDGKVAITAALSGDLLSLTWTERNGPPVTPPTGSSFGTKMIQSIIPRSSVVMDFRPSGLVCQIEIPRAIITEEHSAG